MEKIIIIKNNTGLHARPAARFSDLCGLKKDHDIHVCVKRNDVFAKCINAKSVLLLLSLGIKKGETIKLIVDGPNEEDVINELTMFIEGLSE